MLGLPCFFLRLSLVKGSGGCSSLQCMGFSLRWLLLCEAWALGTRASVVAACRPGSRSWWAVEHWLSCGAVHGLSCCMACGVFPDQRSNLHPLQGQANSYLLRHQRSPILSVFFFLSFLFFFFFFAFGIVFSRFLPNLMLKNNFSYIF